MKKRKEEKEKKKKKRREKEINSKGDSLEKLSEDSWSLTVITKRIKGGININNNNFYNFYNFYDFNKNF